MEVLARAAEVGGAVGYGSGYYLGGGLVLTCAHILREGAHRLSVRGRDRKEIPASVAYCNPTHDVALLRLAGAHAMPDEIIGLAELSLNSVVGSVSFEMYGWPKSGDDLDERGMQVRDPVLVDGEIKVAEYLAAPSRTFRLRPREHYEALETGSFWTGMSGAAVFVSGKLIGVQIRQQNRQLASYLAARPLTSDVLDHHDPVVNATCREVLAAAGVPSGIQVAGTQQ
jgi:hypothetical protein